MKIIYNNIIPFKGYIAINLFGLIFARHKLKEYLPQYQGIVINHELIHTEQYKEMLYVLFLVWYLLEYLVKLCICLNFEEAYKSVSFEQEANYHEIDEDYLEHRQHYFWFRFVFKMWK